MERDQICQKGRNFIESDNYLFSRYTIDDKDCHWKLCGEVYDDVLLSNDEFMRKSWEDVLLDTNRLQLKIIYKITQEYIGEVSLRNLDSDRPEIGIQLLRKYHNQGIGTQVMQLFIARLKEVVQINCFSVRIFSNNYISQRLFEKIGAVQVGTEGKEYSELMAKIMNEMGRDKFEQVIQNDFENTQHFIICYEI